MQDEKKKFVHDVGIGQVTPIDTLESSIRFTKFADDLHHLQSRIMAHGSRVFTQLPRLAKFQMLHQALFCAFRGVPGLHEQRKEVEQSGDSHHRRIALHILFHIVHDLVGLGNVLVGNGST